MSNQCPAHPKIFTRVFTPLGFLIPKNDKANIFWKKNE
jgi:hypothetical protein